MKGQKIIFYISVIFAVISLSCGVIGEFEVDRNWSIYCAAFAGHRDFFVNLSLGIFTGAALSAVTSLISYHSYKQQVLFRYWTSLEGHLQALNLFGHRYFKYGSTTDECIDQIKDSNEILSDVLALEASYTELAKLRKEISIFFQKSAMKKKIKDVFELAGEINIELTQIVCIHICKELSLEKQRQYANQFNIDNSNLDQFKSATQELQELLGFEVKKIDLEKEDFVCHN